MDISITDINPRTKLQYEPHGQTVHLLGVWTSNGIAQYDIVIYTCLGLWFCEYPKMNHEHMHVRSFYLYMQIYI